MRSREYSFEELYKLIMVVRQHPEGGHCGETFWSNMIVKYGPAFFGSRAADNLKGKWRKILHEVKSTTMCLPIAQSRS